jgi:hypothetical protein
VILIWPDATRAAADWSIALMPWRFHTATFKDDPSRFSSVNIAAMSRIHPGD